MKMLEQVERAAPDFWKDTREREEVRRGCAVRDLAEEVFDAMVNMGMTLPRDHEKVGALWLSIQGAAGRMLDRELPPLPAPGIPVLKVAA